MLQLDDGSHFAWEVASVAKVTQTMVERSENFRSLLGAAFSARPSTPQQPFELVFYCDETVPGNVLRPMNDRKCMAVYFVFRNIGPWVRSAAFWIPWAVIRTNILKRVLGGWATAARELLRRCFLGGMDPMTQGVLLNLDFEDGRKPVFLHFRLCNILGDLMGLASLWSWKGPNATMPCFLCANVVRDEAVAEADRRGWLVALPESDYTKFVMCSSTDLFVKADALAVLDERLTRGDFQEAQKACGLNLNKTSALWDKAWGAENSAHTIRPGLQLSIWDTMWSRTVLKI